MYDHTKWMGFLQIGWDLLTPDHFPAFVGLEMTSYIWQPWPQRRCRPTKHARQSSATQQEYLTTYTQETLYTSILMHVLVTKKLLKCLRMHNVTFLFLHCAISVLKLPWIWPADVVVIWETTDKKREVTPDPLTQRKNTKPPTWKYYIKSMLTGNCFRSIFSHSHWNRMTMWIYVLALIGKT